MSLLSPPLPDRQRRTPTAPPGPALPPGFRRPPPSRGSGRVGGRRLRTGHRAPAGGRWLSAAVVTPLLALVAVVNVVNLAGAPQRVDDEGTYVAQAYAVQELGELAHYTFWYDHPPLGWLQLAGYTLFTSAFERAPSAVLAGREAMVVATLVSAALVWLLARRLSLPRWGAALAVALFGLSPLAVTFHRAVYLDNISTMWVLAALVLAASPQRRLAAFAFSGLCLAMAVLTKETALLALPMVALVLWRRSAGGGTRRYGVAMAGSLFTLAGAFYVLYAMVKGELFPHPERVSLLEGVGFQLISRTGGGSVFDPDSLTWRTVGGWVDLDPVLPAVAVLATVLALVVPALRELRAIAIGFLVLLAVVARTGYLPVPYVVVLVPPAAVLTGGLVVAAWQSRRTAVRVAGVAGAIAAVAVAAPVYDSKLTTLLTYDADAPLREAQRWVVDNVPKDRRVIVDDSLWVDLLRAGFARENVVWYYKVDTDPAVQQLSPDGWRDYDYVVSTATLRSFPDSLPEVRQATEHSVPVATFGEGAERVEVRRIDVSDPGETAADVADSRTARAQAGAALARNRQLQLPVGGAEALRAGEVDGRLLSALALASREGTLTVAELPREEAEARTGQPLRSAVISAVGGRPVSAADPATTALLARLEGQPSPLHPDVARLDGGRIVLTYRPLPPDVPDVLTP